MLINPVEVHEDSIPISVIQDIKAEIKNHCLGVDRGECKYCSRCNMLMGIREILSVIDKHIAESEG